MGSRQVKICGVCNFEDAQLAIDSGADFIGFIFVKSKPRYIDPQEAKNIVTKLQSKATFVGVFQNCSLEELEESAALVNFDYFQLHGCESPALCQNLSKPVIKTVQLSKNFEVSQNSKRDNCLTISLTDNAFFSKVDCDLLAEYQKCSRYILFDKPKDEDEANWLDLAIKKISLLEHSFEDTVFLYFIAGGLNVANVNKVLNTLKNANLDLASGVEMKTRKKCKKLISEFFAQINKQIPSSFTHH